MPHSSTQEAIKLLGAYKAEWLNGQLFELFTEPAYFRELKTAKPCVLIGGRGTGKTTVLKGMSFEGQYALSKGRSEGLDTLEFFGLYYRINTNRVTAFRGPELTESAWIKCFSHYINLEFCRLILEFTEWYELRVAQRASISIDAIDEISTSLGLAPALNHGQLLRSLRLSLSSFEASINNIVDVVPEKLSLLAAPVDRLSTALSRSALLKDRPFYFLIDEFENLEDYQQKIFNTILKHTTQHYTMKIGVKELGWRERATLSENESLKHPADYQRIEIAEYMVHAKFSSFASRVCEERLSAALKDGTRRLTMSSLLPYMSQDDEVLALGGKPQIENCRSKLLQAAPEKAEFIRNISAARLYFLEYWSASQGRDLIRELERFEQDPTRWERDFNNHGYASLFAIRSGKRGVRKIYAGWDVFVRLADGNIRFLLELVHSSLQMHAEEELSIDRPIRAETQTRAAQAVARRALAELEGLSVQGARLTKLVLSLGRVFGVLAQDPKGHAPEINQFHVAPQLEDEVTTDSLQQLLVLAVMHLALVRNAGTKLLEKSNTQEYDYMLHPIFSSFFYFSHRRKRKIELSPREVLGLVENHQEAISAILKRMDRLPNADLPDQMQLFQEFYA